MSFHYPFNKNINLFVKDRISKEDADRQERTAKEILRRLEDQPGLILADEVGMGKTFVALAVAISIATSDEQKRPVVVMIPSTLKEKWPRDFEVFKEKCLTQNQLPSIYSESADTAIDFLKLLDDPEEKKKAIIFLTHGAMSRGLTGDAGVWIKLALIQRALHRRWNTNNLKKALHRNLSRLLRITKYARLGEELWEILLESDTNKWLRILNESGIEENDNPVPDAIVNVISCMKLDSLYDAVLKIPKRDSPYLLDRIANARHVLNDEIKEVWTTCLKNLHIKLPLLILDEAHHLKNSKTQLSSLFKSEDALADAEECTKGPLAGMFERMLFLTATPFQLGHYELCSVLERFHGISWQTSSAPSGGQKQLNNDLDDLKSKLDEAQESAVRLDHDWERLTHEDILISNNKFNSVHEWWTELQLDTCGCTPHAAMVLKSYQQTREKMKISETALKKWVIRHLRQKRMKHGINRRKQLVGRTIIEENDNLLSEEGLEIQGSSLLPFLLSARLAALSPETRPFFSEGLASSYEAFLFTRKMQLSQNTQDPTDGDDDKCDYLIKGNPALEWYLMQLEKSLPPKDSASFNQHPKVKATVNKVINLWKKGEKVLVFCHYVATGKVLRQYISEAMKKVIQQLGAAKIGCTEEEVIEKLDTIGTRFFGQDSKLRKATNNLIKKILQNYAALADHEDQITDIFCRYLRTPTFLVRYFPVNKTKLNEGDIESFFNTTDESGLSLKTLLEHFFIFLQIHCGEKERDSFIDALLKIQTGSFMGSDMANAYTEDELQGDRTEKLLPNVRLVNGTTKQESRQKIMLTFNTPFYPEVLIASSVMAEGIDLHLNCRYIIHHDLCWNPSTLEQRNGRVDRIGAKVERCSKPISIYYPFISETQDEKMYRVVMDRERWFKVVMGEKYKLDVRTTEKVASRIPFPDIAAEELMFRLEV